MGLRTASTTSSTSEGNEKGNYCYQNIAAIVDSSKSTAAVIATNTKTTTTAIAANATIKKTIEDEENFSGFYCDKNEEKEIVKDSSFLKEVEIIKNTIEEKEGNKRETKKEGFKEKEKLLLIYKNNKIKAKTKGEIYCNKNELNFNKKDRKDVINEFNNKKIKTNVSVNGNMAPARTEPLNQTSEKFPPTAAASASPRPITNNNHNNIDNNNILLNSTVVIQSTTADNYNNKDNLNGTKYTKNLTLLTQQQQQQQDPNKQHQQQNQQQQNQHSTVAGSCGGGGGGGTFQLAFEKAVAKQQGAAAVAAATAAVRQRKLYKKYPISSIGLKNSNGPTSNKQMGPMCDRNTSSELTDNIDLKNINLLQSNEIAATTTTTTERTTAAATEADSQQQKQEKSEENRIIEESEQEGNGGDEENDNTDNIGEEEEEKDNIEEEEEKSCVIIEEKGDQNKFQQQQQQHQQQKKINLTQDLKNLQMDVLKNPTKKDGNNQLFEFPGNHFFVITELEVTSTTSPKTISELHETSPNPKEKLTEEEGQVTEVGGEGEGGLEETSPTVTEIEEDTIIKKDLLSSDSDIGGTSSTSTSSNNKIIKKIEERTLEDHQEIVISSISPERRANSLISGEKKKINQIIETTKILSQSSSVVTTQIKKDLNLPQRTITATSHTIATVPATAPATAAITTTVTTTIPTQTPTSIPSAATATTSSSISLINSQQQSQFSSTSQSSSNTGTSSSMGLQKDYVKDSVEMDQVLGDMDLLQVLKGLDSNPSGETFCDLAGGLVFFTDDVMNYEEMAKDTETKEIRSEIEKRQLQMQRKCDFFIRRLRKIQSRYMGKHASQEITGLLEWTNRIVRRKDPQCSRQISYDEDKYRPVSMSSMRAFMKRIDLISNAQHSNQSRKLKISRYPYNIQGTQTQYRSGSNSGGNNEFGKNLLTSIVPQYDTKTTEEIDRVSGLLQTELKQVQSSLDSDITASSSGGESADEMVTYNNQSQKTLSM